MPAYPQRPRRVLIASSHPLFAQGLRSLLRERQAAGVEVVGVVANLEQALAALSELNPDLIIVDYDDDRLNREEFLARFVEGEQKLRVVLLSLQSGGEALVYDRRTLGASQIDEWIDEWITPDEATGIGLRSLFRVRGARSKIRNRRDNMKHFVIAGILVIVVDCLSLGRANPGETTPGSRGHPGNTHRQLVLPGICDYRFPILPDRGDDRLQPGRFPA